MAGGRSSRFGRNKLSVPFRGRLLIESVVGELRHFPEVLLITKNPLSFLYLTDRYPNLKVVPEAFSVYSPICGIYTALKSATFRKVLILPGDTPLVRKQVLEKFSVQLPPAVLTENGKVHSLFTLLLKDHIILVEEFLKRGRHRLRELHSLLNSRKVPFSLFEPFDYRGNSLINVNRPEEYYEAIYR